MDIRNGDVICSPMKKHQCGEIYFENEKLQYYCLFCHLIFERIETFTDHLYEEHLYLDPPSSKLDPTSVALKENYPLGQFENVNVFSNINKIEVEEEPDDEEEANRKSEIVTNSFEKFFTNDIEETTIKVNHSNILNFHPECTLENNDDNNCTTPKFEINKRKSIDCSASTSTSTTSSSTSFELTQCEKCSEPFTSERKLKIHLLKQHNHPNSKSAVNKVTKPRLNRKIEIIKGSDNLYHCKICTNKYETVESLRKHTPNHYNNPDRICELCGKQLSSRAHLRAHLKVHTGDRPYKCTYCPKAFADGTNFQRHVRIHLGDKRYTCDYCDKRFVQRSEKKIHERMVHTKERLFQCELCGRKFYTSVQLNDHKKRHANIRPFKCDVCNKQFYNKTLLQEHQIAHTGEKPHECEICSTKFGRRKALLQHMKIHSQIKSYICKICNKGFTQNAGLYSHMKSHTGNLPSASTGKSTSILIP